jgi:L-aspartate oxidase
MFRELSDEINRFYRDAKLIDDLIGLRNAVEMGHQVIIASRRNTESVGCFFRKN